MTISIFLKKPNNFCQWMMDSTMYAAVYTVFWATDAFGTREKFMEFGRFPP